jgi:predicted permease
MHGALYALLPSFVLIALGFALRRGRFLPEASWEAADRLVFYVFFPALLLRDLATADLAALPSLGAAAAMAGAVLATTVLLLLLRRVAGLAGGGFAAVLQGSIRPNVYIAVAAGAILHGGRGATVVALAVAATVPLVNVISALALAPKGHGPSRTLRAVVFNPLVLACAGGLAINGLAGGWGGAGLPALVDPVLGALGRAALPLGLISVGAGLDLFAAADSSRGMIVASLVKLGLLPLLTWLALSLLGVGGAVAAACVLFAAVPTSVSAYAMTRQMGGDHRLMAGIITVETLLALATLPAWFSMLR